MNTAKSNNQSIPGQNTGQNTTFNWDDFENDVDCALPSNIDWTPQGEIERLREEIHQLESQLESEQTFIKMMSDADRELTKEDVIEYFNYCEFKIEDSDDRIFFEYEGEKHCICVGQLPFVSLYVEFYIIGLVDIERLKRLAYHITALSYTAKICIREYDYYFLSFQVDYYAPTVGYFKDSFENYMRVIKGTRRMFSSMRAKNNL